MFYRLISNLKSLIEENLKKRENLKKQKEEEKAALIKQEESLKENKESLQSTTDNLAAKKSEYEKLVNEYPFSVRVDESGDIVARSQEELVKGLNRFRWKQKFLTNIIPKLRRENELRNKWPPTFPPITFSPVLAHLNLKYYCTLGLRFMFKHVYEPFELKPSESCFDVYHMIKSSEENETQEASPETTEESKTSAETPKREYIQPYAYDEQRQLNYVLFMDAAMNSDDDDSDSESVEIVYTEHSLADVDDDLMFEVDDTNNKDGSQSDNTTGQDLATSSSQSDDTCQDLATSRSSRQRNDIKSPSDMNRSFQNTREGKVSSKVAKLDMASVTISPKCVERGQGRERTSLTPVPRRVLLDIKDVRRSSSDNSIVLEKSRSSATQPKVPVKFKEHRFTYPDGTYSKTNEMLSHSPYAPEKMRNKHNLKKTGSVMEYEKDGVKRKVERSFAKNNETTSTREEKSPRLSKHINISKLQGQCVLKPVKHKALGINLKNEQPKPAKTPKCQTVKTSIQKYTCLSKFVTDDKFPVAADKFAKKPQKCKSNNTPIDCRNGMPVNVIRPFGDNENPNYIKSRQTNVGYRKKKISLDDETQKLSSGIKNKPKVLHNLACVSVPTPERYRSSEFIAPSSPARTRSNESFCPRATKSSREPRKLPMRKQKSIQDIIAFMSAD